MAEAWLSAATLAIGLLGAAVVSGAYAWRGRLAHALRGRPAPLGPEGGAERFDRVLPAISSAPISADSPRSPSRADAAPADPSQDSRRSALEEPLRRGLEQLGTGQSETRLELQLPTDSPRPEWQRWALRGRFANGELEGFACLARDVTREKELEQELARQSRQVQTLERALMRERDLCGQILSGSPSFVIVLDAEDRITRISPSLCEALGYQADELLGRDYGSALHSAEGPNPPARAESRGPEALRSASGEPYPVEWRWRVIRDEQGLRRYRLGLGSRPDRPPERPAPAWSDEQHLQLIEAEKLLALAHLISGVAHEIGNPNHVIQINLPLLQKAWEPAPTPARDGPLASEVPQMLAEVQAASQRIQLLVGELHAYVSGEQAGSMEVVYLDDVVSSALTLIASTVRRATSRFRVECADALPPVWGDLRRLEQVLINLILNATEALRDREQGIFVQTAFDAQRAEVVLRVTDEGVGIEPEFLSQVLAPGFTSKQTRGGKGLGLAIAQHIAETHGGRIEIESEPGKGTRADLRLPAHSSPED